MKVLSLFDGISCGMVALERAGVPVERYAAYEIDKHAIAVSQKNYPQIEQKGDVFQGDFTQHKGFELLIGGSPCTYWSIAKQGRETTCKGFGWTLFQEYVRALKESGCRWFLYENNYSIHKDIKAAISRALSVEPIMINSSLVSAQSRKRCYWTNIPGITQPADRGILLRDIIDSGLPIREKAYTLDAHYYKSCGRCGFSTQSGRRQMVAEPVRIGTIESSTADQGHDSKQRRVYSTRGKSTTLCAVGGGGGAKTGLYAIPYAGRMVGRRIDANGHRDDYNESIERFQRFELNENPQKTNCLSTVEKDNLIIAAWDGKTYPVYEVWNGRITIKGRQYPIKLTDGFYIIRKLKPVECERLQTLPDGYTEGVSATQRYKCLRNGWTVDVIAHILRPLIFR